MYDLNLSVPNLTSKSMPAEDKFRLLKNYLFELGDTLNGVLSNLTVQNLSKPLSEAIASGEQSNRAVQTLSLRDCAHFQTLKSEIIRTAQDIAEDYQTAIQQSATQLLATASGQFTAASDFGTYQNQTDAAIRETAAAIVLETQKREAVGSELESYRRENDAAIEVKADAILQEVSNSFASKNELSEQLETVSSQITQTASDITEILHKDTQLMQDDLTTLGGTVSTLATSLDVYIRRGELEPDVYGIEIGRSDSSVRARFTNDKLSFMQGEAEVAYISGNNLYITRAEILDYLKIGNANDGFFTLDTTENGLEVRWNS